ncbi:MAG: DctP family TRAP transporter solute-binding subunit [Gammaproteobacteria bacterium]|nr:DctP family TRAP transporter solute-binding subunit [Gammaproteobacteria bacterium]NIP87590.1 DctP family TRAP transporter solute-binding subunit [Gammaproteobacteria bacterium]NIR21915.1 DctP family TRAP transporter solute-binding subunit [Gammaproteobacteria bacterium]NIS03611.1 DctP family TRAP transporter solute-binding subunit [Gammaproteobacteria bacterium]NIU40625.1 DctP family TRAP transporter solute-binding subunit [Gammaproteobacteria bacterium]
MKLLKQTAFAAALVAASMTGVSQAADVTIRVGHLNPADPFESHSGAMTAIFKSLVESASAGAIEVKLFPNGQLGKDNEVIQQVRDGIVESTISSAGGIAQHYPLVGVFDIPFAFPNIAVANRVIDHRSAFGKKFTGDLEAKTGLKVLGMIDSGGFFAFSNSQRPIKTVEDMKGLKIRTMTLPTHKAMVDSLGAQATPLPWAEVYTSLQTGVAHGQMNPIPIIVFAKFDEVQKYLSITNHVITPYIWTMNRDFYNSLSPAHRAIVDWASEVATEAGRGVSRVIEASDRGLPKLAKKMQVNVVSPAEQKKFAAAAQPAVRQLIEEKLGAEGVDMLNAMMTAINEAQ